MVPVTALWLPVVVSAVFVFIVSSVLHMVFKYHNTDYVPLPNEDAVRAAIRSANPTPREYMIPYCANMQAMKTPEMQLKFAEGPVGRLTLRAPGPISIGPSLAQWFIFSLAISIVVAALASVTLSSAYSTRHIFIVVCVTTWLAYSAGHITSSIWFARPWSITLKEIFDGLLYGLATGAAFVWLWPR
jgi:hypothetical protein